MSVSFEQDTKCQVFIDKDCEEDPFVQYVRLEQAVRDLSSHNVVLNGKYFQSLRCAQVDKVKLLLGALRT